MKKMILMAVAAMMAMQVSAQVIYSDGGINLHAFTFSGPVDRTFTGIDPVVAAKQVAKAGKK